MTLSKAEKAEREARKAQQLTEEAREQSATDAVAEELIEEGLVEEVNDTSGTEWDALSENVKKSRLRSKATQTLLDKHRGEFNEIADALFKEHGLEYKRKLTPKERAAEQVRSLIKEHGLRSEFPGFVAAADEEAAPEGTKVG